MERHWMLEEHRLRHGGWILPGAGYVELIRAAAQLEAPEPPFVLRDLTLLEPFRVGSDEVRTLEVRLAPGVDGGFHVSVQGRRPGRPWVEHATARIPRVSRTSSVLETRLSEVRARLGPPVPGPRPAHPVMAFGPRWENVTGSVSGDGEALLEHQLPVRFQPDLQSTPLHPALLDMATAGATHLVPGLDPATDFLLPVGYGHLRLHGPLADRLSSHVRLRSADETAGLASFDVVVYGPDGEVVLEVDDFTMIRMDGADLLRDAHEAPAWLEDAIDPAEGARVMELLLSRTTPAHVLISRRQIGDLVREADRGAGTRARRTPGGAATPRVLLPEVREALLEHEAVREAAALGSRAESEPARVVAFVEYQPGAHTTVSELRRFLRRRLERRWVPQNFVELVALPRDEAGNVRREELRDPFASTDDRVEPRTPTEKAIAGIWSELLGLERVGIRDNFLDAGGHSLVGIRVLLRIRRETGVRIEAHELAMQTLEQLAAQVDRRRSGGEAPGQEADGRPSGAATSPSRSRTLPDR
ncbi:MAG: polyketide synthase dehydratase domain-containing protein [Gemmatimonadota bacterium]